MEAEGEAGAAAAAATPLLLLPVVEGVEGAAAAAAEEEEEAPPPPPPSTTAPPPTSSRPRTRALPPTPWRPPGEPGPSTTGRSGTCRSRSRAPLPPSRQDPLRAFSSLVLERSRKRLPPSSRSRSPRRPSTSEMARSSLLTLLLLPAPQRLARRVPAAPARTRIGFTSLPTGRPLGPRSTPSRGRKPPRRGRGCETGPGPAWPPRGAPSLGSPRLPTGPSSGTSS